jgi:ABC-2 type transport system ATP-binding protein
MQRPVHTLEINQVALTYGNQKVLDDISFSLQSGRILALIGPNGAGKSSTMRVLAGLVKPEAGFVRLNDDNLTFSDLRKYFGYFIESPSFYNYLTARENLDMLIRLTGSDQRSDDLIEKVGLTHAGKKKFSQFSKGMKQRLGIAQTLIGHPKFMILDEPFNGLDPEVKQQLMELVIDLARNQGTGVLVTSHLLADLEQMADDFVLLNKGQIYLKGRVSDYINEKQRVTLLFNKPLPKDLALKTVALLERNESRLLFKATAKETEDLLLELANRQLAPYSVQRSDLLHEKYMEIAE